MAEFIVKFGTHALSLDLLAGAISEFFDGKVEDLPAEDVGTEPAQRLAYVLRLYESNLPVLERDLLSRLCVFRFGVDSQTLARIFLQSGNPHIAGSLAGMTADAVDQSIGHLVDRHLVYRESKQRYTVHPAVRDHFYRLFRDPSAVHSAIAKHFSTLTDRPGIGLPVDKESLDLLEELVHHALAAKSFDEAAEIYFSRLGGNDHLNGMLGEYARTFRILAGFQQCPDPSAMYHCERAFGNLEKALDWRPQNRYIQLLAGKLLELGNDPSESTRMIALALQGREVSVPERSPDFPICSAMVHLWRGEPDAAKRIAEMEIALSSYKDDQVRNQLALAEVYRGWGRLNQAKELIDTASEWVLQSASQEHLSTLHLTRAQVALDERALDVASLAIAEGLMVSQEAGFLLHEILFRLASSYERELAGDDDQALRLATHARDLAQECRFQFGVQGALKSLERLAPKNQD
jgi:tetratricopeptide (TPR) repeat protein